MGYTAGAFAYTGNSTGFTSPVTGTSISSTQAAAAFAETATGLSTAICKDGQTTITANIPMAGFKFTGLGAGSANGDSLRYQQLFSTSAVALLGAMDWFKGADIASAATVNLTTATGNAVHVTGTTTITAVTLGSGMWRLVIFDGALTLTHHTTDNNLPGGANITTAANDRALYFADGTTVYCVSYFRAASEPLAFATQAQQEAGSSTVVAVSPGRQHFHPGMAKAWHCTTVSAGTPTLQTSYNITSIGDTGTGILGVTIATDFSSANYCISTGTKFASTTGRIEVGSVRANTINAGDFEMAHYETNGDSDALKSAFDPAVWFASMFGDQT